MTEGRCWEIKFKIEVSERHTESHNPVVFSLVFSEFDSHCDREWTCWPVGFNLSML